ncbi:unnamed protein product [Rhizophagus irregularis]|nr:unnamed protein product [Rhizophagus irregularis]
MESLEHLFICTPSHLDAKDDISELLNQKDITGPRKIHIKVTCNNFLNLKFSILNTNILEKYENLEFRLELQYSLVYSMSV